MDVVLLILLCVFAWMFYSSCINKQNKVYRILCAIFNIKPKTNIKVSETVKNEKKYTFGKYVTDVAQTATFMITTKRAVPVECINKIFMSNNKTLHGISAICYIMNDGLTTVHRWKIYVDSAHDSIIGCIANEIANCYN